MRVFLGFIALLAIPTVIVGFGLRQKGLNEKFAAINHPMNQKEFYYVAHQAGSAERPGNTWEAIQNARRESWQVLIWLDVQQTKDGQLVLFGDDMLESQTEGKGHIGFHNWDEIKDLDAGFQYREGDNYPYRGTGIKLRKLEDTLMQFPLYEFILNIKANNKNIDLEVTAMIEKLGASDRIILTSPFEFVLMALRKQKPLWMFGIGHAEFTRLSMFASVGLEPLMPLKGDILIPQKLLQKQILDENLIHELQRRKKRILTWVDNENDWEHWRKFQVDGLITNKPTAFIRLLNPQFDIDQ